MRILVLLFSAMLVISCSKPAKKKESAPAIPTASEAEAKSGAQVAVALQALLVPTSLGLAPGGLDICAAFSSICSLPSSASSATGCTFTCPVANTIAAACNVTAERSAVCDGKTYTLGSGTSNATIGCVKTSDSVFTLSVNSTMNAQIKGGEFTTPVAVVCSVANSLTIDTTKLGTDASKTAVPADCGTGYSCTVNGKAITCDQMKKYATEAKTCKKSS